MGCTPRLLKKGMEGRGGEGRECGGKEKETKEWIAKMSVKEEQEEGSLWKESGAGGTEMESV